MRKPYYKTSHRCWYVKSEDHLREIRLDPDEDKAYETWREMLDAGSPESATASVAAVVEAYLEHALGQVQRGELQKTTLDNYGHFLAKFCTACKGLTIRELRPFHVTRWLDAQTDWGTSSRRGAVRWQTERGPAMPTQCPHCDGVVGFVPQLVGMRVRCPHCDSHFIMREDRRQVIVPPVVRALPTIRAESRIINVPRKKAAAAIYSSALIASLIFAVLGWASDPPVDLLQYIGLTGICLCIDTWICSLFRGPSVWRTLTLTVCVAINVAGIAVCGYFDTEEIVRDKDNFRVVETCRRFRPEIIYRKVIVYDDNGYWVGTLQGPTSPESGAQHGHWEAVFASDAIKSSGTWYWYGQEVTEGEWQRRIRGD